MHGALLKVEHLFKSYDGRGNALADVSFEIAPGQLVALIGQSGAGKSTLLRCINRLIDPTAGKVFFEGTDLTGLKGKALRRARRKIAMVFQQYNLVERSSVIENVLQGRLGYKSALAGTLSVFSEDEKRAAVDLLEQVGLGQKAYVRASQLSGGQKQRVGVARALIQDPLLVLADEPIASLDPKSSRDIMKQLRWAVDTRGISCLVSLHQVEYAREFADRIIGISDGVLVFDGTPEELTETVTTAIYSGETDISSTSAGQDR